MNIKQLLTSLILGFGCLVAFWSLMALSLAQPEVQAAGLKRQAGPDLCLESTSCDLPEAAIGQAIGTEAPLRATFTRTVVATKDNTLFETGDGSISNGQGQHFFVGRTGPAGLNQIRRGVIAFDLTGLGIPANAIVTTATLKLNATQPGIDPGNGNLPQTVTLHRLLANWGEGDSNADGEEGTGDASQTGDATWIHRFHNGTSWTTAGGQFNSTITASRVVATFGPSTWSSAQMAADVQFWLNNPGQNFGWIVRGNEAITQTAVRFDTRENPNPANRPELTIEYTLPQPQLALTKHVSDPLPGENETVIYTIVVANNGTVNATGARIADTLPADIAYVGPVAIDPPGAGTPGNPGAAAGTVASNLTITASQRVTVSFPVRVKTGLGTSTRITNTASVTDAQESPPASGSVVITVTNFAVNKQASNETPRAGEVVTFTIIVTNVSNNNFFTPVISDILPAGLTFKGPMIVAPPAGPPASFPIQQQPVTLLGSFDPGERIVITIPVTVNTGLAAGTVITNIAGVTSVGNSTPTLDPAVLTIAPPIPPNFTLVKQVNDTTPEPGQLITYTIIVANSGPGEATGGIISDTLPPGLLFAGPITLEPPGAGDVGAAPPILVDDLTLAAGESVTVTLPVIVNAGLNTIITNTAWITSNEIITPTAGMTTVVVTAPPLIDMTVTKEVDNPRPNPGDIVTFTISVTNTGVIFLDNIVISDALSSGLIFLDEVIIDPPGPPPVPAALPILHSGFSLAPNASIRLIFPVEVDSTLAEGTPLTNTVEVTSDEILVPEVAQVSLAIPSSGLTITKLVDNPAPIAGGFVNYTIVVTNIGNIDATNGIISDTLPAGMTLIEPINVIPAGAGTPGDNSTLPILVNDLTIAPGAAVTVIFAAATDSGIITDTVLTNTVSVTSTEVITPATAAVSITVTPPPPISLSLLKQVSNNTPQANETITYTIIANNNGQTTITGILISDTLPSGLTFVGPVILTPPGAALTSTPPVLVSDQTLDPTERLTLTFRVLVNSNAAGMTITNTARVTGAQLLTPTTASVPLTVDPPPPIELDILKRVNDLTPTAGDTITYTIRITNSGAVTLTNVRVADTLPAGVSFVGPLIINPGGTTIPNPPLPTLATIPSLNPGSSRSLVFKAVITSSVPDGEFLTNLASTTSTQVTNPVNSAVTIEVDNPLPQGNIYLPVILKGPLPDLRGSFTLSPGKLNFASGEPVLITAVVTNVGEARAEAFWVDFYINPSPPPAANTPWNSTCTLSPCYGIAWYVPGGLGPGESVTLTSTSGSYSGQHTIWPGSFAAGTQTLYLFVDSWNPTVPTGGVFERNENNNRSRLGGLTVTGLTVTETELPNPADLPVRPALTE